MPKMLIENFAPETRNEGGPVRKLAAAARAVMEPFEGRIMQSASPATVLNQQVSTITAKFETQALNHAGEAASDPTVWVNPTDASKSTIIGTDKSGGISVYDLSGKQIQYISDASYFKVDTRSGFSLGGKSVSIVASDRIESNSLALFTVDPTTRQLHDVTAGTIKLSIGGNVSGVTMYQSAETGKTYVFVGNKTGGIEQFELSDNGAGKVSAKSVRTFSVGSTSQGMVADDATGSLFVSQDNVAIWKYGAEPTDGSVRVQIDNHETGYVGNNSESLALYQGKNGSGYLIAARQNTSDYVVYDRQTGAYITTFKIDNGTVDGASSSDGIAVTSANLGGDFTGGAFVVEDDSNTGANQNYKVVSWGDIARAQSIPLSIDAGQNPVEVTNPTSQAATTGSTATTTIGVDSLDLFQANSDTKLVSIKNGSVISLADFDGTSLNVRATTHGKVGSVKFGVNNSSNYHIENYSSYDLSGTGGVWTPTAGTYTITATAYSEHQAKGTVSESYSVTFTIVDAGASTSTGGVVADAAPAPVKGLIATASSPAQVGLNWTAGDDLADGFRIERSADGGTTYKQIAIVTGNSYMNTGLTNGVTYTYRVTAFNSTGDASGVTASATAVTLDLPTSDPTVSGDRPSATNTGVQDGVTLKTVTGFKAASNTTYTGLRITNQVTLTGMTNVKFVNCVFDGGGTSMYNVRCDNATNITIQNCELTGSTMAAVWGDGFKCVSSYIYKHAGDGFKPGSDVLIQGNYITQLGWGSPDAHADGVQIRGGSNIKIVGNYFDMPKDVANTRSNATLFLQLSPSNVVFDSNWLRGGNYCIHAYVDSGDPSTVKITNNIYYAGSSSFGFGTIGSGIVVSGNKTETGLLAIASTK